MTSVGPAQIENTLISLWEAQKKANKMRASLFNLIFYTHEDARIDYVRIILHKVIEKFPSRILFITHKEGPEELKVRVSVIPAAGEADFACDLIEIEASGKAIERVPFLLLPHLLPDLPVTTVWAGTFSLDNPLFDSLSTLSQRVIVDSAVAKDPSRFARELLQLSKKCNVADLTWGRIENWRRLLSTTFHSEERLNQLLHTKQLHILYNSVAQPIYERADLQALYLQGWLTCQLGWKRENIEIILTPEEQTHLSPGSILSLDLTTQEEFHFSFGRDLHFPHQISMRFSTLQKCDIPLKYIFPKSEAGHALVKEIGHQGTSPHLIHLLEYLIPFLKNKHEIIFEK